MDDDDYRQMIKELKDPAVIAEVLKWAEQDWPDIDKPDSDDE